MRCGGKRADARRTEDHEFNLGGAATDQLMLGYLGLGSNIGDRQRHLTAAAAALPDHGVDVEAGSSLYETEPVGLVVDQPDFLNACLRVETDLGPEQLLDACKEVERAVGRRAGGPRHGPRVIDVDLLLLGELQYSSPRLTLPHPEVSSRRFVLVGLLELDPELALPSGERLADKLAGLPPGQAVRQAGSFPGFPARPGKPRPGSSPDAPPSSAKQRP